MIRVSRQDIESMSAYSSVPLDGVDLDLRDNLNLWGAPPRAIEALRAAPSSMIAAYPSAGGGRLNEAIAASAGVRPDEVITGCGSDDVIDAFMRATAMPGDTVAHPDPSFSMVPLFARLNGLRPLGVPLLPDGSADVDGLLATGARVIYLCSPNNPTGTITPASEIRRLVERAPGVVLLDEAYAEFSGEHDWRADAVAMERVLVTRTFSKAWGLAGLRVGYGTGGRGLVAAVAKARGPYKVNALAEIAATTALTDDAGWMRDAAADARVCRERLTASLDGRAGIRRWDSRGNFIFLQLDGNAAQAAESFRQRGIGVRAFAELKGIDQALRFAVAPWAELERVARHVEEMWPCV